MYPNITYRKYDKILQPWVIELAQGVCKIYEHFGSTLLVSI